MSQTGILLVVAVALGAFAAVETPMAQPVTPTLANLALQAEQSSHGPLVRAQFLDLDVGFGGAPGYYSGYSPGYWGGYGVGPAYVGAVAPSYYGSAYYGAYPGAAVVAAVPVDTLPVVRATVPVATVGVVGGGGAIAACAQRYRSFNPATGTFTTYSGIQVLCPYFH